MHSSLPATEATITPPRSVPAVPYLARLEMDSFSQE